MLTLCLTLLTALPVTKASVKNAAAEAGESVELSVLMYHSILNSRKGKYIVSEKQFEDDLLQFLNQGYVTVFPSAIIAYANGSGTLPSKPLLITFDDGHYNNLHYALPILKKHNAKALLNIIGCHTEYSTTSGDDSNPNYSHVTWGQVRALEDSGVFEIGNHTYNLHKFKPRYGIAKIPGESPETYQKTILTDINKLQKKLADVTGKAPEVFAYPFGKYEPDSAEILKKDGFKMILTCSEGTNIIKKGDPNSIMSLKRFNRDGAYTTTSLIGKIQKSVLR